MSNVINLNKTIKDGFVQGPKRPVNDRTTAASPRRWRALAGRKKNIFPTDGVAESVSR